MGKDEEEAKLQTASVTFLDGTVNGMNEGEAEITYLDEAKELSTYGVWQFPAKDSKGVEVSVGISAQGILIFREAVRLHRFSWQSIVKISYRRHYFSIKLKAGEMEKKESTQTYDCFTYEEANRVWKCGVEHHTFFRLIQPELRTKGSFFHWGSSPFRFQGRTSFQNKMASQMFDQPTNVVRSPGSERQMRSLERVHEIRTRSNVELNDESVDGVVDCISNAIRSYIIPSFPSLTVSVSAEREKTTTSTKGKINVEITIGGKESKKGFVKDDKITVYVEGDKYLMNADTQAKDLELAVSIKTGRAIRTFYLTRYGLRAPVRPDHVLSDGERFSLYGRLQGGSTDANAGGSDPGGFRIGVDPSAVLALTITLWSILMLLVGFALGRRFPARR